MNMSALLSDSSDTAVNELDNFSLFVKEHGIDVRIPRSLAGPRGDH